MGHREGGARLRAGLSWIRGEALLGVPTLVSWGGHREGGEEVWAAEGSMSVFTNPRDVRFPKNHMEDDTFWPLRRRYRDKNSTVSEQVCVGLTWQPPSAE